MRNLTPLSYAHTFTVPAGSGDYAPEVLYLTTDGNPNTTMYAIQQLRLLVRSLPATAEIEVDLFKGGNGNPTVDGAWNTDAVAFNATGLSALQELAGARVRIRARSGGTGGTSIIDVYAIAIP